MRCRVRSDVFSLPRILFIDDDPAVLDGLRRALSGRSRDWEMHFESDPLRARDTALACPFQVVVSDLNMPGLNGLELLAQLKAGGSSALCIILTGAGDMASAMDAINRIGVFRFYTKPCSAALLEQGVVEALEQALEQQADGRGGDGGRLARAALDRLPFAALAVDKGFHAIFMNRTGAQLLSSAEVLRVDGGGICRAVNAAETAALHNAIAATAADGESRVLGLNGRDDRRYSALVEPPQDGTADPAGGAVALVFLREIDARSLPTADALRELFNLNPSEARLAHALASGLDIKEAAEAQDVTLSTARTYLKRLFQKTGVNRQAELIRLLLNSVAGL